MDSYLLYYIELLILINNYKHNVYYMYLLLHC